MTDQPARFHVEFSSEYERRNLRALRGSVEERAHLFSHWDEVLPQRPLRAAAQPHRFERRLRPLDVEYEFAGDTRTIDDYMDRNDIAGLLVIAGGAVVHETYRLGIDAESRFHLWSAAKSFTSIEGFIRMDRSTRLWRRYGSMYGLSFLRIRSVSPDTI